MLVQGRVYAREARLDQLEARRHFGMVLLTPLVEGVDPGVAPGPAVLQAPRQGRHALLHGGRRVGLALLGRLPMPGVHVCDQRGRPLLEEGVDAGVDTLLHALVARGQRPVDVPAERLEELVMAVHASMQRRGLPRDRLPHLPLKLRHDLLPALHDGGLQLPADRLDRRVALVHARVELGDAALQLLPHRQGPVVGAGGGHLRLPNLRLGLREATLQLRTTAAERLLSVV
mmetsp:Transcript_55660/g.156740  ORF Transcript_55660/g.156740 Transcript_55660/m.156740 type:complete len:230 (-) Transcript_55660:693-1382(-)